MSRHLLSISLALAISSIGLATTSGCVGRKATDDRAASPSQQPAGTTPNAGEATPGPESTLSHHGATYTDPTYGFSIDYPKDFVLQVQDVSKLPRFTPAPLASIFFMNPTMAAGGLAGIEPPDLEVRVYRAEAVDSLKSWLISAHLASSEGITSAPPFRNTSSRGLRVCQSTMIAPGCSVYVLHGNRVYQLTAISLEGEAMVETFSP